MTHSPDGGQQQASSGGPTGPDRPDRPDAPGAKKVGFAAFLGFAMVLLTTATALYSGYLLWRGDPGTDVLNNLPQGCAWVVMADDPVELRAAASDVAKWHVLPHGVANIARREAGRLLQDLDTAGAGIDPDAGLGLCRFGAGVVLSVGLNPDAKDAIGDVQRAAAKRVGLDPADWTPGASAGGFVEYALAGADGRVAIAALQAEKRAIFVWTDADHDATALLTEVVKATQTTTMRDDAVIRAAIERVGSGAIQVALAPATLRRFAKGWLAGQVPAAFVGQHAEYAGGSLRRDAGTGLTHLHLHIGAGKRGVAWLKSTLDPTVKLAASSLIDADADGGGVLRVNPEALRRDAAWLLRHPAGRGLMTAIAAPSPRQAWLDLAASLTGNVVWQIGGGPSAWRIAAQLRPGQDAAVAATLANHGQPDAWAEAAVVPGWLVFVPAGAGGAAAAGQDFLASRGLGAAIAQDRARLLNENQGFFLGQGVQLPGLTAGTVQFEALWIHTGFVAHLTFPTPR